MMEYTQNIMYHGWMLPMLDTNTCMSSRHAMFHEYWSIHSSVFPSACLCASLPSILDNNLLFAFHTVFLLILLSVSTSSSMIVWPGLCREKHVSNTSTEADYYPQKAAYWQTTLQAKVTAFIAGICIWFIISATVVTRLLCTLLVFVGKINKNTHIIYLVLSNTPTGQWDVGIRVNTRVMCVRRSVLNPAVIRSLLDVHGWTSTT
jgi:hypothetical protein